MIIHVMYAGETGVVIAATIIILTENPARYAQVQVFALIVRGQEESRRGIKQGYSLQDAQFKALASIR